jgi:hypothetical protein
MSKPTFLASLALPRLFKIAAQLGLAFVFLFNAGKEVFAASISCSFRFSFFNPFR